MGRVLHSVPVRPLLEVFLEELESDSSVTSRFDKLLEQNHVPPCYYEHTVVQQARANDDQAYAYDFYLDGVPTTKRDGVIGFWAYLVGSTKRHLVAAIRKSRLAVVVATGGAHSG